MVANCRVSLPPVVSDGHAQLAFSTNQPQLASSWPYYQCENFTYGFVLDHFNLAVIPTPSHRPVFDCCQFSDKNSHLTSKTANWLCWLSRKVQHTPTQTSQNWAQFRKAQLTQVYFSRSSPGQEVMSTNQLAIIMPLSLSLEWSQVTHLSTCTKMGRAYIFQDGSLPSSTFTNIQANSSKLYTHSCSFTHTTADQGGSH